MIVVAKVIKLVITNVKIACAHAKTSVNETDAVKNEKNIIVSFPKNQ